jgi:hypothetical protein
MQIMHTMQIIKQGAFWKVFAGLSNMPSILLWWDMLQVACLLITFCFSNLKLSNCPNAMSPAMLRKRQQAIVT